VQRDVLPAGRNPLTGREGWPQRILQWSRPAGAALTLLHLTAVYWFAQRSMSGPWVAAGSMVPLHTIRAYLALGPWGAAEHLGGELLLLAPLGVLLPVVGGRVDASPLGSFARTAFGGLMLAFAAEVVRDGVAGQIFDLDVVLLNAAGVVLAHVAAVPAGRAALRRRGIGRLSREGWTDAAPAPAASRAPAELVP
jgi:hypothetical protein